ncbi:mitochondrial genome maintenance exonuclease 1 [Lasioglossum baleicum]|uniref:mitochondrial genome maintenance exonuclease 1 n=1 Tax=Lasioglossum baleicum TaxID=434251 RepID=UPI003FCCDBFF
MFGNKYFICPLLFCRSNINCISRQCVRNLSLASGAFQKLKLREEKEVLENVCRGDIDIANVNVDEQCCGTNNLSTTIKTNMCSEIEAKSMKEIWMSSPYEMHKQVHEGESLVLSSITTDKLMSKNILNPEENNGIRLQNSYTALSKDVIKKMTSFPLLASKDSTTESNGGGKKSGIPSVTVILRETMPLKAKAALELWKKNMIEKLGQQEFNVYCQGLLRNGRLLHSCIQGTLNRKEVDVSPQVELAYNSVKPVLSDIDEVKNLETYVTHPNLMYRGIVDCIAIYRGELCVIDWKKSDTKKSTLASTYDAPVQVSAYIGAVNASGVYPFTITKGMVVVAYTNGDPATVHEIKEDLLEKTWKSWLRRLKKFYGNLNK